MQPGGFVFRAVPAANSSHAPLILLHGTGGDETSLLAFGRLVAPTSELLAVRGTVPIEGGYSFFRRHPDRQIDETDLRARVPTLAAFITSVLDTGVANKPVVVGYSNGAIMTTALLQTHPRLLGGAVLLRALPPFCEEPQCQLPGLPVLIIDGTNDKRRARDDGGRVAISLRRAGANVRHHVLPVAHAITDSDTRLVRDWLTPPLGGVACGA